MTRGAQRPRMEVAVGVVYAQGKLLVQLRPHGAHLAGTWELPGGKLAPGETPEQAVRRELEEELGLLVSEARLLHVEEHAYPERDVVLHFFWCLDVQGAPEPREGQELRWVTARELEGLPIPDANRGVLALLREHLTPATAPGSGS